MNFLRKNGTLGFTLIEMMVSISIFSMVVVVSAAAILSIVRASQKVEAIKSVMENLNFAVESMSRVTRFGNSYSCNDVGHVKDCYYPNGASTFGLIDENGNSVSYRLNGTAIERQINSSGFIPITSAEVVVTNLQFFVEGSENQVNEQPKVKILIQGYAGQKADVRSSFNLETLVSERRLYFGN